MPARKKTQPDQTVALKLTATERKLILSEPPAQYQECAEIVQDTPTSKSVTMTLEQLDDLCRLIAFKATHCDDPKRRKTLDALFRKAHKLLGRPDDEPQTLKIEDARKEQMLSQQAVQIAEFAAQVLVAAEQLRIKAKPLDTFWLAPAQRDVLLVVPTLSKAVKNKLSKNKTDFTVSEVASMTMALAEDLPDGEAQKQVAVLMVAKHLMDCLQEGIMAKAEPPVRKESKRTPKSNTGILYQFKITLLGYKPSIWRRIQVRDCTLDKLHEHIQTSMGWTNSHLHQFEIGGERYGDPALLDDGFDEFECEDSTTTMLSEIVPKTGKRFSFRYEYDFGDGWEHEVMFEGSPPLEKGKKYPLCLEGERSCPPEDVGGVWGYAEYLEALADPKHERHEEFMEWSGPFDPDKFDPKKASREMKKGLPDWRSM